MATKAIVGEKVGMTQVWDDDNRVVPVTVLRVKPCRIVQVKTDERDGYTALQVTFGTKKASKITKPKLGQFEKAGVDPGPQLVELRLDDVSDYSVGQELEGRSADRRRQGRRHGGQQGQGHRRHHEAPRLRRHARQPRCPPRRTGPPGRSAPAPPPRGCSAAPGCPAAWAAEKVTTLNLTVVQADAERDLVLVRGSVPGPKGGLVAHP